MTPHLGLVVEGQGDAGAVPILLERILALRPNPTTLRIGKPISCGGRDRALRPNGLEGFVAAAVARPGCGALLIVLDGEGDAVCHLGPDLLSRALSVSHVPTVVALADRQYESWLLASAETMRLPKVTYQANNSEPASVFKRGLAPKKYVKPTWQPRLTERMDLTLAVSRNASLARLVARVHTLADEL